MMRTLLLVLLVACGSPTKQPAAPQQPESKPAAATPEPGCPTDQIAAVGTDCPTEDHVCNARAVQQATGFSNLLVCKQGKWKNIEVPPPAPK